MSNLEMVNDLQQQLAAAKAACKLKDEALEEAFALASNLLSDAERQVIDEYTEAPIVLKMCQEALAIQPDDSALKAWLGEPVAYCDLPGRLKYTISGLTRYSNSPEWIKVGTALYSPKELK